MTSPFCWWPSPKIGWQAVLEWSKKVGIPQSLLLKNRLLTHWEVFGVCCDQKEYHSVESSSQCGTKKWPPVLASRVCAFFGNLTPILMRIFLLNFARSSASYQIKISSTISNRVVSAVLFSQRITITVCESDTITITYLTMKVWQRVESVAFPINEPTEHNVT